MRSTRIPNTVGEVWLPVPGFPNYRVSNRGRVLSLARAGRPSTVLAPRAMPKGYLRITLWDAGRSSERTIHSLVMLAFVGPPHEGLMVCHGDGDPAHNDLRNLRYGTALENAADRRRHGNYPMKTHCVRGHEYTPENTMFRRNGNRACRTCRNALRRTGLPRLRKTHCKQGHPFDDENTRIGPDGSRRCRACQRLLDEGRPRTGRRAPRADVFQQANREAVTT